MTPETVEEIEAQLSEILDEESKIYPLEFTNDYEKQGVVILNHWQNRESLDSIRVLARMKRTGDVGIIGRSVFDSVLNMGLLLYLPISEGVRKYERYTTVELLKVYRHMADIEEATAHNIYKAQVIQKYELEAKQYEIDYGEARSSWSGKSAMDVCRILDKQYPPVIRTTHFFEFLYCQIYRFGSSITHRSELGLLRSVSIDSISTRSRAKMHTMKASEEGLLFNYFHSLIAFLVSMRIAGRAFGVTSLESYFQRKIGSLVAGYPE